MIEAPKMPSNVAWLGYAGLLPPAALLVADKLWFGAHPPVLAGLVPFYAALIFSFFTNREWNTALSNALVILAGTEAIVILPCRARRSYF